MQLDRSRRDKVLWSHEHWTVGNTGNFQLSTIRDALQVKFQYATWQKLDEIIFLFLKNNIILRLALNQRLTTKRGGNTTGLQVECVACVWVFA